MSKDKSRAIPEDDSRRAPQVLELDPVPVALRGYLVKSDPGGRNFTKRFFILRQLTGSLCYARAPEDMEDPLGVIFLFGSRLRCSPRSLPRSRVAGGLSHSTPLHPSPFPPLTPPRNLLLLL